jgi:FixJ family two-component response regulator
VPAATTRDGPICVVDDHLWVCDSLSVLLETYGYRVLTYSSGEAFLEDERRHSASCLVIDQHMPGLEGLDVVAALHGNGGCPPTVLITGRPDAAIAARARAFGLLAVLEKPFAGSRLVELIGSIVQSLRT